VYVFSFHQTLENLKTIQPTQPLNLFVPLLQKHKCWMFMVIYHRRNRKKITPKKQIQETPITDCFFAQKTGLSFHLFEILEKWLIRIPHLQ